MPRLAIDIPHSLGRDEAERRLKEGLIKAGEKFKHSLSDFQHQWSENSLSFAFKALGMAVSGVLIVEQECVRLAASIPLAAAMFQGVIEDKIREEFGKLLA